MSRRSLPLVVEWVTDSLPADEGLTQTGTKCRIRPESAGVRKPLICAVNGVCAGAGMHFVADADIVIASSNASFTDAHVTVGQVAALEPIGLLKAPCLLAGSCGWPSSAAMSAYPQSERECRTRYRSHRSARGPRSSGTRAWRAYSEEFTQGPHADKEAIWNGREWGEMQLRKWDSGSSKRCGLTLTMPKDLRHLLRSGPRCGENQAQ